MERNQEEDEDSIHLAVYLGLLALTALTVAASRFGEGRLLAISVAVIIASAKAGLIGSYFMELRRERLFLVASVAIGIAAVAILLLGLLPDLWLWR